MTQTTQPCPTIAVFGTASDVGKSLISAGLCRLLSDAGYRVAPFKAQNLSNNSGVSPEGGEMGRAQIVQAWAARVTPHVDMNPVLIKPGGETGSQTILLGQPWEARRGSSAVGQPRALAEAAFAALGRLRTRADCVVMEGAGSCAEVNLRAREFVNFPAAHEADAAVVLVADIERGGVFAQIIGSLDVMLPEDRERVVGFIINRFHGDPTLFEDGIDYLQRRTGKPVFGVVPFLPGLQLDAEDGQRLDAPIDPATFHKTDARVRIAVLAFPHLSNATDFDPLLGLDALEVHYLRRPRKLDAYDLVILPGSKNVRDDLGWLQQLGWTSEIQRFRQKQGRLAGICGGYQMLGRVVHDPDGVEGAPGSCAGLGYFPTSTTLASRKVLRNVQGRWSKSGSFVEGYEIHMGHTQVEEPSQGYAAAVVHVSGSLVARESGHACPSVHEQDPCEPLIEQNDDGLISADGRIWGTYLHGLFDSPEFLIALLSEIRPEHSSEWKGLVETRRQQREKALQVWAAHVRRHVDVDALLAHRRLALEPLR